LADSLDLQTALLNTAAGGRRVFGDLVATAAIPPVARVHALHLICHHRLAIDLAAPPTDAALVWSASRAAEAAVPGHHCLVHLWHYITCAVARHVL
jgi:hypothetical protein